MDQPIDVADCLRRWKRGDEQAAVALINHLYPVIIRIVRTHRSRREAEEDFVQEILVKTFSRLNQYQGEVPFTHWVSRLAVTTCLDRLRAQKIRPEIRTSDLSPEELGLFNLAQWESRTPDAGRAIEARDLVEKLLSILAPEDRGLVLMVDLEGKSLQEMAEIKGWTESKIKMRLFRARGRLREAMQRLEKQNE